jgi:MoxR-like ATPase
VIESMPPAEPRNEYQRFRSLQRSLEGLGTGSEWEKIDKVVSELEVLLGVSESESGVPESAKSPSPRVLLLAELGELRNNLGNEEDFRKLEIEAKLALYKFGHVYLKVRKKQAELQNELYKVIFQGRSAQAGRKKSELRMILEQSENVLEQLAERNPISLKAYRLWWIRDQKKRYAETGIIETPQLKRRNQDLLIEALNAASGNNNVVTLMGPTGSGKTVLAKEIAYQLAQFHKTESDGDKKIPNYYFVSAHSRMTPEDLLERNALTVQELPPSSEVVAEIRRAKKAFETDNSDLSPEEREKAERIIEETILRRSSAPTMITEKVLEAVGLAAEYGRPVIIDEFNYLPPETLAALNNLLSGKHKPGFKVIFTGNPVSREYLGRKGLDPALINRILSGVIKYDFPPQELRKSFSDSILDPTATVDSEAANQDKVPDRDLFQIACLQLVDDNGNLYAPDDVFEQVWDLTRAFAIAQRLSSADNSMLSGVINSQAGLGDKKFKFDSVFLSFRNLNTVVEAWKNDGYTKPLGWYVTKMILLPASILSPQDAAQLAYLFLESSSTLKKDLETKPLKIDHERWSVTGLDQVTATNQSALPLKHYTTDEVVQNFFGKELPSYETLGVTKEHAQEAAENNAEAAALELRRRYDEARAKFVGLLDVEKVCQQLGQA